MYSYLITFHMNNGHMYKTVLTGKNLEDLKENLNEQIRKKESFTHFILNNNKNIHFIAVYENISIIEIELLSTELVLEFKELTCLTKEELALVFSHVANDFIIGVSLLHVEASFVTKFYEALPERRKEVIANIIKLELGKIKMTDVLQAQNAILEVVEMLYEQGEIVIPPKDDVQ